MPWNWDEIIQNLPEEKRMRIESLHIQADMIGPLPTIERKALRILSHQLEGVFMRAFEETYESFDLKVFEMRLKRLKNQCGQAFESYFVYFPGVNLYISNGETGDFICSFRVAPR